MKSNCFISTTAIVLIAHFITWFILIATIFGHWWRKCLNWYHIRKRRRRQRQFKQYTIKSSQQRQHQHQQQEGDEMQKKEIYEFRPFEVMNCNYKDYSRGKGRGITTIPKARSGHRVAANEIDLFSFGGMCSLHLYTTNQNK